MTPLLKELNWLPVSEMLKVRDAVIVYKRVSNLGPVYLCTKFEKRSSLTIVQLETMANFKSHYLNQLAARKPFLTEQCPYEMN